MTEKTAVEKYEEAGEVFRRACAERDRVYKEIYAAQDRVEKEVQRSSKAWQALAAAVIEEGGRL